MKLETQHIFGYLPFKLKILIDDVICDVEGVDFDFPGTIISERVNYDLEKIKPILRPLSDLSKSENYGLYLDLCDEMTASNIDNMLDAIKDKTYYVIALQNYEKLETFLNLNHFDWKYDLIKNGLALDHNEVKNMKNIY
jgi:hypothetical protein